MREQEHGQDGRRTRPTRDLERTEAEDTAGTAQRDGLSARSVLRLQRHAGNAAVTHAISAHAERPLNRPLPLQLTAAGSTAGAAAPSHTSDHTDNDHVAVQRKGDGFTGLPGAIEDIADSADPAVQEAWQEIIDAMDEYDAREGGDAVAEHQIIIRMLREFRRLDVMATTHGIGMEWLESPATKAAFVQIEDALDLEISTNITEILQSRGEVTAAYSLMGQGALWHRPALAEGHEDAPRDRSYFDALSRENKESMLAEARTSERSDTDARWMAAVETKLRQALNNSVLRHYTTTDRANAMLAQGRTIDSNYKLQEENPDAPHNTSAVDANAYANHAFVFFFIEVEDYPFRPTRFARAEGSLPARITVPFGRLRTDGMVMLNDFNTREHPVIRADEDGNLRSYERSHDRSKLPVESPEAPLASAKSEFEQESLRRLPGLYRELESSAATLAGAIDGATGNGDLETISRAMVTLLKIRKALAILHTNPVFEEMAGRRNQALAESKRFHIRVRDFHDEQEEASAPERPAQLMYMAPNARPGGGSPEIAKYSETLRRNVLVGPDIVDGLVARTILEIARIERQGQFQVAGRLKGMSGDGLLKVLTMDIIRPQAMLPWSVPIQTENVEYGG